MASLFDELPEEQQRIVMCERLYSRGWRQRGGTLRGKLLWRCPETGALLEEQDAIAWLVRLEAVENADAVQQKGRPETGPKGDYRPESGTTVKEE